ncbi:hypothetical protein HNP46_000458 [Pseudomonas nitritireducens]|uniref:Uncharacterized protein n=1 Tax=Pseudomonas nitroreducens TaxID=46680 RepID=A0A7W7KF05_PSENT|nr:hypothetical protein [Pseudomonas nitritireducens]MBB4861647.1 hypothetical protein [Pseudomonas nitritireducens]
MIIVGELDVQAVAGDAISIMVGGRPITLRKQAGNSLDALQQLDGDDVVLGIHSTARSSDLVGIYGDRGFFLPKVWVHLLISVVTIVTLVVSSYLAKELSRLILPHVTLFHFMGHSFSWESILDAVLIAATWKFYSDGLFFRLFTEWKRVATAYRLKQRFRRTWNYS